MPNARIFTPQTPFHHPHLDPSTPEEDLHLVPPGLFGGGVLSHELPKPAAVNLHIKLKLSSDTDNLLKEFHDRIPQIERVLEAWGENKDADPSSTGEAHLRAQKSQTEERNFAAEGQGTTFNLMSSLDTPGRADIYFSL